MKKILVNWIVVISFFLFMLPVNAISLKEIYDSASAFGEFHKYIELQTGEIYTGGLHIGKTFNNEDYLLEGSEGLNVKIIGNGAILDLKGEQISISYCENILEIEDCIILNGNVRFRGINVEGIQAQPVGSIRYVTFYQPHDYGIRLQGSGDGIIIERNLVIDAICTGDDFVYTTGMPTEWLPTGMNYSFSVQNGFYGTPIVLDNWSFFSDEQSNSNPLLHFGLL